MRIAVALLSLAIIVGLGYIIPWSLEPTTPRNLAPANGVYASSRSAMVKQPLAWIGISCDCASDLVKSQLNIEGGLAVTEVVPNTPAERSGLMANDIILSINGMKISCCKMLSLAIEQADDSEVCLSIIRGGEKLTICVRPEPRPQCDQLVQPIVISRDTYQVQKLEELDIRGVTNPLTGEVDVLILGSGLVMNVDPVTAENVGTRTGLQLSPDQINRLSVEFDWDESTVLTKEQVQGMLRQAIDAGHQELRRLEHTQKQVDAKADLPILQLKELHRETERVRNFVRSLEHVADTMNAEASSTDSPALRSDIESDRYESREADRDDDGDGEQKDDQSRCPRAPTPRDIALG